MFWFYIIILSSHLINGLLTGFARALLRNTGPWSFSTALASSGCTKTAVLYFSVWPSHPVSKPLVLMTANKGIQKRHLQSVCTSCYDCTRDKGKVFVRKRGKSCSYGKHVLFYIPAKSSSLSSTVRFHTELVIKDLVWKVKSLPGSSLVH